MKFTSNEQMTVMAAREIKNGDIVFCGTGISMVAAMAAKHIHAPESIIFFETGSIDSSLEDIPLAVSDPRVMSGGSSNGTLFDAFSTMQNRKTGDRVIGILGAAQIDRFANLNTTVIGNYHSPRVRLAGSGGSCDVASFVPRLLVFMKHEKRRFVSKLDYLTSPGYIDGPQGRQRAGLPERTATTVITNMGIIRFNQSSTDIYLDCCYSGITPEQILENTGFEIDISRVVPATPPTNNELEILRKKCDPEGYFS